MEEKQVTEEDTKPHSLMDKACFISFWIYSQQDVHKDSKLSINGGELG